MSKLLELIVYPETFMGQRELSVCPRVFRAPGFAQGHLLRNKLYEGFLLHFFSINPRNFSMAFSFSCIAFSEDYGPSLAR